jgi:hypothetical protein
MRIWARVGVRALEAAIEKLKEYSQLFHTAARHLRDNPELAKKLRVEADEAESTAEQLRVALYEEDPKP